jgi:hypothetical protein
MIWLSVLLLFGFLALVALAFYARVRTVRF